MIYQSSKNKCHSKCYFEQPAEKLVLQGYRYWTYGRTNYCEPHLAKGWALHTKLIENENHAREVLDALCLFVKVLDKCASCPLKALPVNTHFVSRDEGLVLGLISSIQNGNDDLAQICLVHLTCASRCAQVAGVAERYATTLRLLNHKLQPIPSRAIDDLLAPSLSIH